MAGELTYSLTEAAKQLGLAKSTVSEAIHLDKIRAEGVGTRRVRIPASEIKRYRQTFLGGKGWAKRRSVSSHNRVVRRLAARLPVDGMPTAMDGDDARYVGGIALLLGHLAASIGWSKGELTNAVLDIDSGNSEAERRRATRAWVRACIDLGWDASHSVRGWELFHSPDDAE